MPNPAPNRPRASSGALAAGGAAPPPAAAGALAASIVLLALARGVLAFQHSMWAWSLNLMRFLHPAFGWGLWAIGILALLPPIADRLAPMLGRFGDAIARAPGRSSFAWALAAAALAWALPDRLWFVGDFLMRQGTVRVGEEFSRMFPQALPLDRLLHYGLPRFLTETALVNANGAARTLGIVEAGGFGALAVSFARALGLSGAGAFAAAVVVLFGGYLGLFTGFSKAFAELCLLVAATGVYGLQTVRSGRGLIPLGVSLALGLTLHRSALGLIPATAVAWWIWCSTHGRGGGWRRGEVLVALAIPVAALAVMLPRIVAVILEWDPVHFASKTVELQGGVLKAALAGTRPADLLNLLVMLSPLAPVILIVLPLWLAASRGARAPGWRAELLLLVTLALPFLAVMPFLHPAQGLYRDWDDFAATGVAVSLLVSWTVARSLGGPRAGLLAVAVTAGSVVPTVQWLAHQRDVNRGLERVRAFMLEPPRRSDPERGTTWDYLGIRSFGLERYQAAADAFALAAETSPSPRILHEQAAAETMLGHYHKAQDLYHRMLALEPDNRLGWLGLGTVSANLRDLPEARRAAQVLLQRAPDDADALRLLEAVERLEANQPSAP